MDFLNFKITDLIDILLVAVLLYYVYKLVKGSVAINIFIGIVLVWVFWKITQLLGMEMISSLIGAFMQVGLIALIIVFQQEIRRFLLLIGSTNFNKKRGIMKRLNFMKTDGMTTKVNVDAILAAAEKMASTRTGAIIVIERDNALDSIKSTGDQMHIEVNQPILESIFYKNSPLHDGAAVITEKNIVATRVILPVSNRRNIPLRFGLRHRAAIGISEKTDAVTLVVSEETGSISYIRDGEFVEFKTLEQLSGILKEDLS